MTPYNSGLLSALLTLALSFLGYVSSASAVEQRRDMSDLSLHSFSERSTPTAGYFDPSDGGGSLLTKVSGTFPPGQHEPLNAILSANSDAAVLKDQQDNGGLRNYFQSIGFSSECLGQVDPSVQQADLGDGNGFVNETAVIRWDYGDPTLGTCKETVEGGNHFRYWTQNGKDADSGAIFMGVSYEKPIQDQHDIIDNGYNLARDWLVGNATSNTTIPTSNLTNTSTYSGTSSAGGYTYQTDVIYIAGLLPNTSININHNLTVGVNQNAVDGLVAVLTVHITSQPERASSSSIHHHDAYALSTGLSSVFLPLLLYLLFIHRL